jgi:hypothetical protein
MPEGVEDGMRISRPEMALEEFLLRASGDFDR